MSGTATATASWTAWPAFGVSMSAMAATKCLSPDARPRLLQLLLQDHPSGRGGARCANCGDHAGAHEPRLLHRLGLRGERYGRSIGAALLGGGPAAAAAGHHRALERLSRQHHGGREPGWHEAHACARRPADPRHRPGSPTGSARAAGWIRMHSASCAPRHWRTGSWSSGRSAWRRSSASRSRVRAA